MAYTLGLDYGTESCRAVLVDLDTGAELGSHVMAYPHGVVDAMFPPTGKRLPHDWALQYPADYLTVLRACVTGVVQQAGIDPARIVGIGIDTTACTLIPVAADDSALADHPDWAAEPHAYAKLWKDHSAQPQAARINAAAQDAGLDFLDFYGGAISSEWVLAKTLKLYEEAPSVFTAAARIYECGDWLVSQLVGQETRGSAVAGYKASYQEDLGGYPPKEFLDSLAPGYSAVLDRLGHTFLAPGERAGSLTSEWAESLGLRAGIAVAASNLDAHVAALGSGISEPHQMLLVMGTSVCNLMLADNRSFVQGAAGLVKDGLVPGFWAYEAGQAGVGDTFGWFARTAVPPEVHQEAARRDVSVFDVLEERARAIAPGGTGMIALDWFNGSRSPIMDGHLSGLLVGMTLRTTPAEIYRALMEGAALGQRAIVQAFRDAGVPVKRIVACGGLPARATLFMQILADALDMDIEVSASEHTPAVGAALHAAVAAGEGEGGFGSFADASRIASPMAVTYTPNPAHRARYNALFTIYSRLSRQFGNENQDVMHSLRAIAGDHDTQE